MIQFRDKTHITPADIIDDIKSGKIHLVCMAQNGLTHLNVYAQMYLGVPADTINYCVNQVNKNIETGTLYPVANVSILPYKKSGAHIESINLAESRFCIDDVFKANELYIKSGIILFSMENSYIDTDLVIQAIGEKIESIGESETFVKEVWFTL